MNNIKTVTGKSSKKIIFYLVNSLLILAIIAAIFWGISTYFKLDKSLYTNDAQVEEYINPINTRIPGYIKEVRFSEHQKIKKGDTLVLIDDREYKIQLEQAEAGWLSASASRNVTLSSVNTVNSNISILDANIKAAEAKVWNAEGNYRRFKNLLEEGAATRQQFDQVKTEFDALNAQMKALHKQKLTTRFSTLETSKRINVNDAEIKRTHAAMDMAKLNLSYTVIVAPYDGVTGRRNIQEGQLLQAGQTLLSFVKNDNKWVVANFRETQIAKLKTGQKLFLKVDGFDNKKYWGRVAAMSQATGSKYSAIPVDNSTGNFVKVQQRIPVKIEFIAGENNLQDIDLLRAGMNVEVSNTHFK